MRVSNYKSHIFYKKTMRLIYRALCTLVVAITPYAVSAQDYPNKHIQIVAPFPPGGGTDAIARVISNKLNETTDWTTVVVNKAGANGTIGLGEVARADPSGYEIVMGQKDNLVVAPLLTKVGFDPLKSFSAIGMVGTTPSVMLVAADSPYQTLQDMLDAAKAQPGKITYGSSGTGGTAHIALELLKHLAKVDLLHVPYKGSAPSLTDLMGGHVTVVGSSIASASAYLKAGTMRALAVSTPQRSPVLPDTPTVAEAGVEGFDITSWLGVFGPAGMEPEVVERLNTELNKVLEQDDVKSFLLNQGFNPAPGTPKDLSDYLKEDYAGLESVISSTNLRVE